MRRLSSLFLSAAAATLAIACSGTPSGSAGRAESSSQSSAALAPSQGVYPYPVSMNANGTPKKDGNGNLMVSWGGSLADLMAADAYADCAQQWGYLDEAWADTYLQYLQSKMTADESCYQSCGPNNACSWNAYWYGARTNSACNYNTSNQTPQAISWDTRDVSAYQAIGIPRGPDIETDIGKAKLEAARQLGIAEENLCMAQKLREQMVTAPGLLMQEADVREALEIVRERAQIATLQYSLLSVVFTSTDTRALGSYNPSQDLTLLRAFANNPSYVNQLTQIGRDFAAAIQLHSEVTLELGNELARDSSARLLWPNAPSGQAAIDWSSGSWRERVLRLMYGGDPLAATSGYSGVQTDALWQFYSGTPTFYPATQYVSEDSRTPQVDELLTYARAADALYFFAASPGVDAQNSAIQIYRTVEASIRHPECTSPSSTVPSCAADAWQPDIPDPTTALTSTLLYQNRKITLDHAVALASRMGQAIPTARTRLLIHPPHNSTVVYDYEGAMHFTGKQQYLNPTAAATALPGAPSGYWFHLAPNTRAIAQSVTDRASPYLGSFYLPMSLDIYNVGPTQGFVGDVNTTVSNETLNGSTEMRTLGAVSAQAVARDALFTAQAAATSGSGTATSQAFVNAASAALPVITAAVGARTAAIRPMPTSEYVTDACTEWGNSGTTPTGCWVVAQALTNGTPTWQITVETTASDPYTQLLVTPGGDGMGASAALDPSFVSYTGMTMASLASASDSQTISPATIETGADGVVRKTFNVAFEGPTWVFLVQPGTPNQYKLLFGQQGMSTAASYESSTYVYKSLDGRWLGAGGSMNALAARLWATQPQNWSQPQYDGFGLPTNWFPPTSADLFGGQPGESAITYYTSLAQSSAATAQSAVSTAVSELLAEEADQATLNNARVKAGALSGQAQSSLCGSSTSCAADIVPQDFRLFGDPAAGNSVFIDQVDCTHQAVDAKACTNYSNLVTAFNQAVQEVLPSDVVLPAAVWAHRWDGAPPTFSNYAGGSLQSDFIADWNALNALYHASYTAAFAVADKLASAAAGQAVVNAASSTAAYQCSNTAMWNAFHAGITFSGDTDGSINVNVDGNGGIGLYQSKTNGQSYNIGALWQQLQSCQSASAAVGSVQAQAAAAIADAWSTAAQQLATLAASANAVSLATANVWKDANAAALAIAQANVDASLTAAGLQTRFGTYRRFYSYDMQYAQQAIQTARLDAVLARRAIESRFVVDLSTLIAPEVSGVAPATWADQIYGSDLAPLGGVGLSISGVKGGVPPVNTYFLTQYVGNLNQFVAGFFAAPANSPGGGRQATVDTSQTDVLNLPAPDGRVIDANGNSILDPASLKWEFQCAGSTTWFANPAAGLVPVPDASPLLTACNGQPPADARYDFSLDGWGRFDADEASITAQSPLAHNFNVRWNRLALNLGGSGVKDCSTAPPGSGCNPAQLYVPYNLTAYGPAWVTDYNEAWHVLDAPVGVIENAQAGATDDLWTVPPTGQAQSEINAFAKNELVVRPVAGTYRIDLLVSPGINLSKIQYVQLFTDVTYWVRQQ